MGLIGRIVRSVVEEAIHSRLLHCSLARKAHRSMGLRLEVDLAPRMLRRGLLSLALWRITFGSGVDQSGGCSTKAVRWQRFAWHLRSKSSLRCRRKVALW